MCNNVWQAHTKGPIMQLNNTQEKNRIFPTKTKADDKGASCYNLLKEPSYTYTRDILLQYLLNCYHVVKTEVTPYID